MISHLNCDLVQLHSFPTRRLFRSVDDDAEAIETIIETPIDRIAGEVLNVATGVDISVNEIAAKVLAALGKDRKSTRLNSSHTVISYAVFCVKKKTNFEIFSFAIIK